MLLALVVPRLPVIGDAVLSVDERTIDWIVDHRRPWADTAFGVMGSLGDTWTILGLVTGAGVVLAALHRWRELAVLGAGVPLEMAVFVSAATLVGRDRPDAAVEAVAVSGGFPSGHAGIAVVVYGGLAVLVHWLTDDRVAQRTAVVLAVVLSAATGIGRLYQSMHVPSDVLAGWVVGAVCLATAVAVARSVEQAVVGPGGAG